MTGPFRCWGRRTLLVLACAGIGAGIGGCTPSSGDDTAVANTTSVNRDAIAPVEQKGIGIASVPVANVAAPVAPVSRPAPVRPAKPAEAAQSLDLPASNAATDAPVFPAEVTTFMVDRDGCDHFRGEEPYDAERAAYLEQSIRELCAGSDARLAKLRRRYAEEPDVIAALGNYEERIESPEEP
ncbi:hypothetical protein [Sphingobium aromaticiconvertens]|uniref:hypothetical protein n=1 Tax=Sphingobium aromaticiconvertens TaxID=365341 RepID=UPI0030174C94